MPDSMTAPVGLADRIRAVYQAADLEAFGRLLAEDVRWGDDDHPNRCRGRADVLNTFERGMDSGVTAEIVETRSGPGGVLCRLRVNRADPADRPRGIDFVHVFLIRDGLISEIRRYDDMPNAVAAIEAA